MPAVRAVIFDLDECLIDSRAAWAYAVEQALVAVTGQQLRASRDLVTEYRHRPWRHVFAVLCADTTQAQRCCEIAEAMFHRSALKRLLVFEGIGMALDALRASRIQIGAISRLPHSQAIKQIDSTGLDRFVVVLSPTPDNQKWAPAARIDEVVGYLGRNRDDTVVVATTRDLIGREFRVLEAGWGSDAHGDVLLPSDLAPRLRRLG